MVLLAFWNLAGIEAKSARDKVVEEPEIDADRLIVADVLEHPIGQFVD